jgi:hypothetical protein
MTYVCPFKPNNVTLYTRVIKRPAHKNKNIMTEHTKEYKWKCRILRSKLWYNLIQIFWRILFLFCLYLSHTYSQIQEKTGLPYLVFAGIICLFILECKIDRLNDKL